MNPYAATPSLAEATPDDAVELNVAVIYENAAAGHRALALLANLNQRLHPEVSFKPSLWRFDLLDHPRVRAQASLAADRAELIFISVDQCAQLPAPVNDWVEDCRTRHSPEARALIFLNASADLDTLSLESDAGIYTAGQPRPRSDPAAEPCFASNSDR
jgi:hypothetical protein